MDNISHGPTNPLGDTFNRILAERFDSFVPAVFISDFPESVDSDSQSVSSVSGSGVE